MRKTTQAEGEALMPTKISWTDETWNVVAGCTKCSPGCKNCYAERMAHRLKSMGNDNPQYLGKTDAYGKWTGEVECCDWLLDKPLHWKKPRRIFVVSMGDLFHEAVPFEFIDKVWWTMSVSRQHTFQVLTKRPKRYLEYWQHRLEKGFTDGNRENIWAGVSISTQAEADEKIPILLQIPAAVRFVSLEPLLEEIRLVYRSENNKMYVRWSADDNQFKPFDGFPDWGIIGCESINSKAGRFQDGFVEAAINIVRQCKAASAGSKRAFKGKDGKLILAPASKFTKPWMDSVKWFAMKEVGPMCLLEGPLHLIITFFLSRPRNHYGTGRNTGKLKSSAPPYPMVTPDLTKLVRAVEDALTGIVWKDDKQVAEQHMRKRYAEKPGDEKDSTCPCSKITEEKYRREEKIRGFLWAGNRCLGLQRMQRRVSAGRTTAKLY